MKRLISIALCFLMVFALCPYAAFAASTLTWTGAADDGSWHSAGNWDLNQVPVDGDYVIVPESSVVVYSSGGTSVRLSNCAGNLTVSGGTLKIASGNSSLTNGKLDGAGDIQITAGGNFLWSGGSIVGSGKIIVDQNANFYATSGISSPLNRYLVNNGSLLISGDSLTLTGGAEGNGKFTIQQDKTLKLGGNNKSYNLSANLCNMGVLRISNACTSVSLSSGYTQQNTGTLEFDIGGLSDFTKLGVTGQAFLNGELKLNISDGYGPSPGDTFEIMTCGSRTGVFSSITSSMDGIAFEPTYTDTKLTLTVKQVTAPTAPQNFTATPGDGRVALSWTAPASDGGATILGYEVSKDSGVTWVTASTSASHTFTDLTNGTAYTFKVRTWNNVYDGAEASATATPIAGPTVPTTPQNFTATPSSGQVALSWEAPASNGGAAISGYEVSKDNGLTWVTAGVGTSHTFIGLTNGTAYTFKVRAVNSVGNGAEASATATPVAPTQPWQLYTWGGNFDGQLGDGTLQNRSTPTYIGTAEDWTTVSAGSGHTVALKSTGSLWAWGSNSYGQLGDGTSELRDSPVHIGSDYDWAAIETGEYHTVALKTDGSLWAWGSNNIGQLGDGTTDNKNVPTRIATGSTWIAVSAGRQHTVAIKSDGSLWAWGANSKGELGDGSTDFKKVPTQISTEQWALVSAGTKFTVALKADGSLWTWGWNNVGQLGDGTVVDKSVPTRVGTDTWLAAAAGDNHVVAIKSGGSLWAWGGNEYGELGNGSCDGVVEPPAHPVPTQIGTDTDWISVTTSYAHNAAFKTDGSLWLWGLNGVGQLGNGTSGNGADSPQRLDGTGTWLAVACGGSHTAAVMEAGLTAPTAPQNFTATPSSGQVALSWEAPASNGGAAISGYQVSKDNGATWGTADTNTSHTFTGLTNGTEYTFKVRAVNSAGNGAEAGATATPAASTSGEFAPGSGDGTTPETAFLIATTEHLNNVRNYLGAGHTNKHFRLTADLDLNVAPYNSGAGWEPIGDEHTPFTGAFDGDGHTISGLVINRPTTPFIGLFANSGLDAKIRNVGLISVNVAGYNHVGGLAGRNRGQIANSYAIGKVTGECETGGLIGENSGPISDSYAQGTVTDKYGGEIGGLVGENTASGTITNCYANVKVNLTGNTNYGSAGGLVGYNFGGITKSYAVGAVAGRFRVGGLAGTSTGTIDKSYATGAVIGTVNYDTKVGGLVGHNEGSINSSFARGDVSGKDKAGGLVGYNKSSITSSNEKSSITDSYATGAVSGDSYIGGLAGYNYDQGDFAGIITNCYWNKATSLQNTSAGGIGKTTAEMKQHATYVDWDFITIWGINAGDNDGYPFLRWQGYEAETTAPTAPQNFTATPSSGQVALSWEAPASNGGAAISGYEVSKDNGVTWVTASTSTSHAFTGLTNGIAYTFKVRAVNSAGNGAEASAMATPTANVCKIGATEYAALDNALATLVDKTPTTITLLQNITDTDGISLSRKKLSIDLNGKTLTVNNSTGIGIEMELSSELNITGPGNLNVCGMTGLYLNESIFAAAENVVVDITSDDGCGLGTDTACSVSMHGNISGATRGISASTGNTITVDGTVTSTGTGSENHAVRLGGRGNTVQVGSVTVSAGTGAGIYVADGGTVTVGSQTSSASVTGKGSGIWTRQGLSNTAKITVYGDVTAGGGRAICATGDADIKVYGDVKSTSTLASAFAVEGFANSGDDISVRITGNVQGPNGVKYHGNNGTISVGGNVTATGDASDTVGVYASYGSVGVTGNVASGGIGAEAGKNGEITIDGVLTGNTYVKVYYAIKTAADKEPNTTKEGYHTYQKNSAVVWIKDGASATTYLLTVQNGTGGGSYLSGTPVSIEANPPAQGKVFDKWTTSNGGSFGDANSTSTTFTMPSGAVTVTATYKDAPVATYAVTVNGSYAAVSGAGSYAKDAIVSFYAGNLSNYSFNGWTSSDVTITGPGNKNASFIMPQKNVTVTANWIYIGGGSGSGSGTPPTPTYKADVKAGSGAKMTLPVTVDKNAGTASIDTGSQGLEQGGTNITIPSIPDVDTYSVGIPVTDLSTPDVQGTLILNTDTGSITVPSNMLTGAMETDGNKARIAIGQGDKSNLSEDVRDTIGDKPLIQLTLSIDGRQTDWNNPDAPVTVSIPYTPTVAELADPQHIVVWYIDGAGNVVSVPNGRYDPKTGTVTFSTTHFSYYAIAYVQKTFDDLESVVWAKESIEVLASKGILEGKSGTQYFPGGNTTRADFLCFLIRTLGVDSEVDGNFDDLSSDAYYYKEIGIAKKLGIASGIGNNKFSADACITRQDMMVLTERALRMMKKIGVQGSVSDIDRFADKSLVAEYAVNSVASLIKEGLVVGSGDKVNPLGNTTRAEAAAFLYRVYNK